MRSTASPYLLLSGLPRCPLAFCLAAISSFAAFSAAPAVMAALMLRPVWPRTAGSRPNALAPVAMAPTGPPSACAATWPAASSGFRGACGRAPRRLVSATCRPMYRSSLPTTPMGSLQNERVSLPLAFSFWNDLADCHRQLGPAHSTCRPPSTEGAPIGRVSSVYFACCRSGTSGGPLEMSLGGMSCYLRAVRPPPAESPGTSTNTWVVAEP